MGNSLRPFFDIAGRELGPAETKLLKDALRDIRYGAENFRSAIADGLGVRNESGYRAISESLHHFNEARFNLVSLSECDADLRDAALKAVERVDRLLNRAVRIERIKRPGNTARLEME